MDETVVLRAAEPRDSQQIVGLIGELAAFEQLTEQLVVQAADLQRHLFGERPVAAAIVAERAGVLIGFALYFTNFSTFLGKPGMYLEDLYVQPGYRGTGVGTALLRRLASIAVERGCGRLEWSVLDWNTNAIGFYEKLGASVLPDWRICRVTGQALSRLARVAP